MIKRLLVIFFSVCICFSAIVPLAVVVYADEHPPRLVDDANLLTESEAWYIQNKLDSISERQNFDLVIVTTNDTGGKSSMDYADDYFDYNGYGFGENCDGALLLINMGDREMWISTCGFGITALTDYGIDYIFDRIEYDVRYGDYEDAFDTFCYWCDNFVSRAKDGDPFDRNSNKEPFNEKLPGRVVISVIIGFVIALIATGVMKGKLKSVKFKTSANDYVNNGSLNITNKQDLFLYSNVSKVRIQSESSGGGSSTHRSSSGSSHGGGGRSF
ncbi:MAG: TPM domain-containing protein [Oscillospiraceae bacterium]|nr:TPM domain-containing protein [Oscillospiraceae bacterium]